MKSSRLDSWRTALMTTKWSRLTTMKSSSLSSKRTTLVARLSSMSSKSTVTLWKCGCWNASKCWCNESSALMSSRRPTEISARGTNSDRSNTTVCWGAQFFSSTTSRLGVPFTSIHVVLWELVLHTFPKPVWQLRRLLTGKIVRRACRFYRIEMFSRTERVQHKILVIVIVSTGL